MRSHKLLSYLAAAAVASTAAASSPYALVDSYDHDNFFTSFDFFTDLDPTHGFVKYVSAPAANKQELAGYLSRMVYLGVDHQTTNTPDGRPSTRVTSQKSYNHGLFVADIVHMPVGCGVWPAFWTVGPGWPNAGEIDIIEGVNSATTNAITLHTSAGCNVDTSGELDSTTPGNTNCNAGNGNDGCSQSTANTAAYGPGLNAAGGGVYVMEWTSEAISVWFLSRGSDAATNALSASPDSTTFGTPVARFSGCDIDAHFHDHNIVFNTALCGDWAGQVWGQDPTCSAQASTCQDYVSGNAADFSEAYWLINRVNVYQVQDSTKRNVRAKPFLA